MGVPSARLRSIAALPQLKGSLRRYTSETLESLATAEREIQRTLAWLQDRRNHWNNQAVGRLQRFTQAKIALEKCRSAGSQRGRLDCSGPEHELVTAQSSLREAEQALEILRDQTQRVEHAVLVYRSQTKLFKAFISNRIPQALAYLEQQSSLLGGAYVGGFTANGPLYSGTQVASTTWATSGEVSETYRREQAAAQEVSDNVIGQFASRSFFETAQVVMGPNSFVGMSLGAAQMTAETVSFIVLTTVCAAFLAKGRRN
jgi:hypothetical protein